MDHDPENMTELLALIAGSAIVSWTTYFLVKCGVRKRGGSEAMAYGFGKLAMLVQAPTVRDQFHLNPNQTRPVIDKWVADKMEKRQQPIRIRR